MRTMRAKLPFGIGQIGKAFRNEITPGNFTFRTIEFEQMEFQTFCKKGTDSETYDYFKKYGISFFEYLGLSLEKLRFHDHEKLAHYAKEACDIEYLFPFGWGEINGTHNRTDFDLARHQKYSGKPMDYYDETTVNVLPLIKKKHSDLAQKIYHKLQKTMMVKYDESGSIGKRYRRGDAIGIPFAITIDDNAIENGIVTIRDRDTMKQQAVSIENLSNYLLELCSSLKGE